MFKNVNKQNHYNTMIESLKQNFISDFDNQNIINKKNHDFSISDSDRELKINSESSKKQENLNYAKISMFLSNFFFSLSAINIKIINNHKPNYNYNLFSAIRFFVIFFLSYRLLIFKEIKIETIYKVKNWKWFILRTCSNHFALLTFTLSLLYVRMSTAACVYMVFPIFTNILSIFLLNEKFSLKYLFACLICFCGCITFSMSERNSISDSNQDSNENRNLDFKIFLGIFFSVLDGFFSSILIISSKFLVKEMNSIQANMFIGFYLSIACFFMSLFNFKNFINDLFDLTFIFYSIINGLVVYGAFHFLNEGAENADLSKTSYISYTQVIFNILFGFLFFGEYFYFIDFLGFVMIIGTNIYLTFFAKSD